MSFVKVVVRRPVTMLMIFVVLVGLGIYAMTRVPIDLFPSFNPPILSVSTTYAGAGPAEVERDVTEPLEAALSGISGVDSMRSTSAENSSQIRLSFLWGTDTTEAANDIRDRLGAVVSRLPDGVDAPRIWKFDPNAHSILEIAILGPGSAERRRQIAEDYVQAELQQIEGVGQADVVGGLDRLVRVDLDQTALAAHGIPVTAVAQAIKAQNIDSAGGSISQGTRKALIRTAGEYQSLEDLQNVVVAYARSEDNQRQSAVGPRPVLLKEVADVSWGYEEATRRVYINGEPGVYVSVVKESGANSVQVADAVNASIGKISATLPAGITLEMTSDTTTAIRSSLNQVTSSLLQGGVLAMLVLFVFLRNWRTTIIIGIAIPVSMLITVLAMYFGGLTLNVISMSGLILALGMTVDSSIVVLDNVYRHRSTGTEVKLATINGTQEMITAITASALTTISVFLPILIFKNSLGFLGIIVGDISFTVVVAIIASLAVATLLIPVLSSTYLPLRTPEQRTHHVKLFAVLDSGMERFFLWLERIYQRALAAALRRRLLTIVAVLAILAVSLSLIPKIGIVFSGATAEDNVRVSLRLRAGTRLEITEASVLDLAQLIKKDVPAIQNLIVTAGGGGSRGGNSGSINVTLPPVEQASFTADDVIRSARGHAGQFPGMQIGFSQNRGHSISGSNAVDVLIRSRDMEAATKTAYDVQRLLLEKFPEVTEPDVDVAAALPEVQIVIDRLRAYDLGVSVSAVATEIGSAMNGIGAGQFRTAGTNYAINVVLREQDRSTLPDLERIFVKNSSGTLIPVSSVASIKLSTSPVSIQREDEQRTVHVTGGLVEGYQIASVQPRITKAISQDLVKPDGVSIDFTGELSAIQEAGSQIGIILAIAIGLVFAVMAGQFESFRSPFIIFFTIPLMFIGVLLLYYFIGTPLSMFSFIGLVMLAGIVVNNGIVLVDYTNLMRTRGMGALEACLEAARHRLRPILMTTLTTILGMAPLAFFPGSGAQITQPIGMTIVGGLASSMLITLFLVPVLYSLIAGKVPIRKIDPNAAGA
ncbi:MAG TPA: efflux RND transporter permease subunit [Spirochaetia bacterium]|nr:efflux RND transporter permease subunit [Spirochaetia bacterium]